MKKAKKIKGFVMNRVTGHTSYAYWQHDKDVHSVGFTHNRFDRARKRKMQYNINPKDGSPCYVKTDIEKQKYNTYREKPEYKNYRIHDKDRRLVNSIISKNSKHKKRR